MIFFSTAITIYCIDWNKTWGPNGLQANVIESVVVNDTRTNQTCILDKHVAYTLKEHNEKILNVCKMVFNAGVNYSLITVKKHSDSFFTL